jgi:hypothetical protein
MSSFYVTITINCLFLSCLAYFLTFKEKYLSIILQINLEIKVFESFFDFPFDFSYFRMLLVVLRLHNLFLIKMAHK